MRSIMIGITSLVLGVLIGCIPVLSNHLHWNIWIIIPISGVIFGILFGYFQAYAGRILRLKLTGRYVFLFALMAPLSYLATDFGHYASHGIDVVDADNKTSKGVAFHQLMSFSDYMAMRLGDTQLTSVRSHSTLPVSGTVHKISFGVDLLACFFVALGCVGIFADTHLYCDACRRYKKARHTFYIWTDAAENQLMGLLHTIFDVCRRDNKHELELCLRQLEAVHNNDKLHGKISIKHSECTKCHSENYVGTVEVYNGKNWKKIDELKFDTSYEGDAEPEKKVA